MRSFLKAALSPPVLVFVLTLAPFLIPLSDALSFRTRGLSRSVGIDPELVIYALVCTMAFWLGYALFSGRRRKAKTALESRVSTRAVKKARGEALLAVFLLLAIGFGILLVTASGSYLTGLMQSFRWQEANPELRGSGEGFIASEHVPGILRMLAYSIVGCVVFLLAVALANPRWARAWRLYWFLLFVSGLSVLARSAIVLDRLPVLTAIGLGVFVMINRMRLNKARFMIGLISVPLLLWLTLGFFRVSYSIRVNPDDRYNQILENADLGIANAALAYRTTTRFGWGTSSLMGPITMVPRGLGIDFEFPVADSDWIWNPASNLLCVSLKEFGLFGFLIYLIYGAVSGRIVRGRSEHPQSVGWGLAHLWSLYILFSIWTQPVVASSDVWAAILVTMLIGRVVDKRYEAAEREALTPPRPSRAEIPSRAVVRPTGRALEALWPEWNYD